MKKLIIVLSMVVLGFDAKVDNHKITDVPTITGLSNTRGFNGALIKITGTGFTGTIAVSFGGTAATSFAVNSDTEISTQVGAGTTGEVSVTTPEGTATFQGFVYVSDAFFHPANDISFSCFGFEADNTAVCSARGTCVAQNVCSCPALIEGSNCQLPIRWDSGSPVISSSFDFVPRFFPGVTFSDSEDKYFIKLKLNGYSPFPGSVGASFGVYETPPADLAHDLGSLQNEWAWLSSGKKYSRNIQTTMSGGADASFTVDDMIALEYDAVNKTLKFFKQVNGEFVRVSDSEFDFENVGADGKELAFGVSVTCFGFCEFELL